MKRRFFRRSRGRGSRRERHWIQKQFDPIGHPSGETQGFVILGPEDYTAGDNPAVVDHCTVLRTVGRCEVDCLVALATNRFNSLRYSAALAVAGIREIENAVIVDPNLADFKPSQTGGQFGTLTRPVQMWFERAFWQSFFHDLIGVSTDVYMPVITGDEQRAGIEWDVTQKFRLRADQALWLFVWGEVLDASQEDDWATVVGARTLYAT